MSALLGFYGLSLIDALNPSALAVAVILALRGGPYRSRVAVYAAAIFATYLTLGLLIYFGLDGVLRLADGLWVERVGNALAAIGGLAMLIIALFPPKRFRSGVRLPSLPQNLPMPAVFGTGVAITLAEFTTALPYLGAIGILRGYTAEPLLAVLLLIGYNVVFVLPPLLLVTGFARFEPRVRPKLQQWLDKRKSKEADGTWLWILGIVGFLLARQGVIYYAGLFGWLPTGG
ncbi:Cytochrome c biogenesis protein CcdA [Saccharopolyspora antimicrobica]|uniref:Cytochrome c biogenesis protein CcdA n=1 Tax=Saccharopolyspora antimicrobica TaxID=455193 RepID=A0A1I4XSI6_9PSEU|nr:GAP family protein [Saccharopolyspora antimicrobica]RKT84632.1 cytochrome c biogenesis protein CcdA [Saccharopolyspora antimicrobica]SFN28821.1 Cytochrome c biogenesis protein CcdA [Saccharopolyspora antimicrobica]